MKTQRGLLVATTAFVFWSCAGDPPPETAVIDAVDTIHGVEFVDPYRWLEDQDSPETREWIALQNSYAELVIGETPLRDSLRTRLRELNAIPQVGNPTRRGSLEFFTLRRVGEEVASIYMRDTPADEAPRRPIDPDGTYELLIDASAMSSDHSVAVDIMDVSENGERLIYARRDGGQDERTMHLFDVTQRTDLSDSLPNALYGGVSFLDDGSGFYYVHRSRDIGPRVRVHRFGTDIQGDETIFGEGHGPEKFINASQVKDGRAWLFSVQHGWSKHEIFLRENGRTVPILSGPYARAQARFNNGDLYLLTNLNAPKNRLVIVDPENASPDNWHVVLPEAEDVLDSWTVIDDKIFATYIHNVASQIRIFEKDGTPAGELDIPEFHVASIRGGPEGKAYLTLNAYTQPATTYEVDLETGERTVWEDTRIPMEGVELEVQQVWYTSKDGTSAPMYIVHQPGHELTGDTPTILNGYGGFNVSNMPRFDSRVVAWVERGGIWALATLRGGGEFGETWHRAGQLENKQNVFDDFISASEWLIENNFTNSDKLAIRGGSNGGLLVGSALTQRPELYRAVIANVPELDLVRFYQFEQTNNKPALLEYGNAGIPEQFEFLRRYSPYQNVRDGIEYPAVLLTTGDLDTRVPPLQARKMTARLQHATSSGRPIILRYNPRRGHAGGISLSRSIENAAAELTFLAQELRLN